MAPTYQQLQEKVEEKDAEISRLELQVKALKAELYGSKADRRPSADEKQTCFDTMQDSDAQQPRSKQISHRTSGSKRSSKKPGPKPLPAHLKRVQISVEDPDLKDLICPETGKIRKAALVETLEVLSRKPAEFFVKVFTRNVFVSEAKTAPVFSPWPKQVMSRLRAENSVVAHVIHERFALHLPYYRLEKELSQVGLHITRASMVHWAQCASDLTEPLIKAIKQKVQKSHYLHLDPTPIDVQTGQKKKVHQACVWAYRCLDGPVYFEFAMNKAGQTPAQTLKGYQGILQTDGASNFGGLTKTEGIIHLGCFAHTRRYFVKAEQNGESESRELLDTMDRLFRRERLMRRFGLEPKKVLEMRKRFSVPAFDAMCEKAKSLLEAAPAMKKTPLSKALRYLLGQQQPLKNCLLHAPSRIDNNLVEQAIRPLKIGAKNWTFIGHPDAGQRNMNLFTLIENCRLAGVHPEAYLIDLFNRLEDYPASKIEDFIPQNWAKRQKQEHQAL